MYSAFESKSQFNFNVPFARKAVLLNRAIRKLCRLRKWSLLTAKARVHQNTITKQFDMTDCKQSIRIFVRMCEENLSL